MAAGLGFKTFTTGEVLTAADTNGYLMQGVLVFASAAARDAAITSPQEGQYAFLKDTDALVYYSGAAWLGAPVGDITAVTAGTGISGGGSSGDVTITNSMATAIDAKGDLIAGTGADTFNRLAVGNNGETLVADSSTSTGLRYQSAKSVNAVINGNMDIWQRGTSFAAASSGSFSADRFEATLAGTSISLTASQQTTVPNANSEYSLRYLQASGTATSVTEYCARQRIEQSVLLPLLGKATVLSFWYRSNKTGSHGVRIYGSYNTGGTDQVTTITVNAADTWEYKTVSVTAFSAVSDASASFTSAGALVDIGFRVGGSGAGFTTVAANDYFQITQVQLEVGSVATTFARNGGSIQGELAACQRYYYRQTAQGGNNVFAISGFTTSSTAATVFINPPVTMRVTPTTLDVSGCAIQDVTNSAYGFSSGTISAGDSGLNAVRINGTISGGTTGRWCYLRANGGSDYIGLGAEL